MSQKTKLAARRKIFTVLTLLCSVSLLLELFVTRKAYFGIDGMFGFFAVLGFGGCLLLLVLANIVGRLIRVKENFYHD